jgi:hypothetical protein
MATCRDIIKRGLRLIGVIAASEEPSADDAVTCMIALQGIYDALSHQGIFNRLADVVITQDYTAKENERILINTASAVTVTYPVTIDDPYVDGKARPPRDLSQIQVRRISSTTREHVIYNTYLARWVSIVGLTLDTEAPFSERANQQLAGRLGLIVAPEYGMQPNDVVSSLSARLNPVLGSMRDSVLPITPANYF